LHHAVGEFGLGVEGEFFHLPPAEEHDGKMVIWMGSSSHGVIQQAKEDSMKQGVVYKGWLFIFGLTTKFMSQDLKIGGLRMTPGSRLI
jgi:hypothetical protein